MDSRYLRVQGTSRNTSRYPYIDISDLRKKINQTITFHKWICNLTPEVEYVVEPLFHNVLLPVLRFSCLNKDLGPVVQSIVNLTSSLRVIPLTVLADSVHNNLIFFAEKMWVAFALLTFFQQKISAYLLITLCKFQRIINYVVSFEQLGLDFHFEINCYLR